MVQFVDRLARWTALFGGIVLMGLVLLACTSIAGRTLNTIAFMKPVMDALPFFYNFVESMEIGSITGDFEMIEAGVAFAIFSFLPYCQLHAGHASVDIFTSFLPRKVNTFLVVFWEVVMAIVIVLICWRLYEGMNGKMRSHETTMLLQMPIWWAYACSFAASTVSAFIAVYCALARLLELKTGRSYLPTSQGAVH